MKTVSVRIDPLIWKKLKQHCAKYNVTLGRIVSELIREFLKRGGK